MEMTYRRSPSKESRLYDGGQLMALITGGRGKPRKTICETIKMDVEVCRFSSVLSIMVLFDACS